MSRNKREAPEVRANRAKQLLDNPLFIEAFEGIRESIVNEMERLKLDGSNNANAAILVQKLQAALAFKAEFVRTVAAGDRAIKRAERADEPEPFDLNAPFRGTEL